MSIEILPFGEEQSWHIENRVVSVYHVDLVDSVYQHHVPETDSSQRVQLRWPPKRVSLPLGGSHKTQYGTTKSVRTSKKFQTTLSNPERVNIVARFMPPSHLPEKVK